MINLRFKLKFSLFIHWATCGLDYDWGWGFGLKYWLHKYINDSPKWPGGNDLKNKQLTLDQTNWFFMVIARYKFWGVRDPPPPRWWIGLALWVLGRGLNLPIYLEYVCHSGLCSGNPLQQLLTFSMIPCLCFDNVLRPYPIFGPGYRPLNV